MASDLKKKENKKDNKNIEKKNEKIKENSKEKSKSVVNSKTSIKSKTEKKSELKDKLESKEKLKSNDSLEYKKKIESKDKIESKKKSKTKKKPHLIGLKEFLFNFISILFVLGVALYFGGRSFYYYSLQNQNKKASAMTLNGLLLENNKLIKSGDGLYKSKDGYYFSGNVQNNYVWFANRMFRVLSVGNDNSVKLVSNDLTSIFMWGDDIDYQNSNIRNWLTNTEREYSGIYYDTLPYFDKFFTKTSYTVDKLENDTIKKGKDKYSDNVVLLTLDDYAISGGKEGFLNNGKIFYVLGFSSSDDNLYIEEDGSIVSGDKLDSYGIRSVVTLKKNISVASGDGTINNPYIINQGENTNYVDSYVKMGNDIWKVFSDKDGVLKMYLNGYILDNGVEVFKKYGNKTNKFNYNDKQSIAYYLNNNYLNNLEYNSYIINNSYPFGEMSAETGYNYSNMYSESFDGRISLLNLFDYVSNNDLTDFYRNNNTSVLGNIQYVSMNVGLVEDVDIREEKHIVPVISINSSSIRNGSGRLDDPYVLG